MKNVMMLIAVLSLAGCGWSDRVAANLSGTAVSCFDGVKYIQFASGVTVKYTREGKIDTCVK